MKIYSMTATFGKLSQQTLKLDGGLNIIEAPNEWGKSTWCAFLLAMLYGIDTGERTKTGFLAEKEHCNSSPQCFRFRLKFDFQYDVIKKIYLLGIHVIQKPGN